MDAEKEGALKEVLELETMLVCFGNPSMHSTTHYSKDKTTEKIIIM